MLDLINWTLFFLVSYTCTHRLLNSQHSPPSTLLGKERAIWALTRWPKKPVLFTETTFIAKTFDFKNFFCKLFMRQKNLSLKTVYIYRVNVSNTSKASHLILSMSSSSIGTSTYKFRVKGVAVDSRPIGRVCNLPIKKVTHLFDSYMATKLSKIYKLIESEILG